MRICLVSHYPPSLGGISRYYYNLAKSLEDADNSQSLFIIANRVNNAPTVEYESKRRIVLRAWHMNSLVYPLKIYKAATSIEPDVIHIHYEYFLWGYSIFGYICSLLFPLLMFLLSRLKRAIVVHFDCIYPRRSSEKSLFKPLLIFIGIIVSRVINRLSDLVIVWTSAIKQILISDYAMDSEKVIVVPHGMELNEHQGIDIDFAKLKLGLSDKFVILFFGFIYPRKGIEYLIWSIKEVVTKKPNAVLVIAGSTYGPTIRGKTYLASLRNLIVKLRLEEHVIFVSKYIPEDEVPIYFSSADVVVLPYVYVLGSASGILAKAARYKKPVVVTSVPMFTDYVKNGVNGVIVPPSNSNELAKAILTISSDGEFRRKLGEGLFSFAESCSWKNVAKKMLELYQCTIRHCRSKLANS